MSIVFVWGEFLSVSWISLQRHGGFLLRTLSERVEIWGAHWPALLSMKLMIKTLFQIQCFPNIPTECWLICFTISGKLYSYLSQVLASDPWRLLIYLCSHQIPHGRSRTAEFPDAQNVTPWSRWCDDHQGASTGDHKTRNIRICTVHWLQEVAEIRWYITESALSRQCVGNHGLRYSLSYEFSVHKGAPPRDCNTEQSLTWN